MGTNAVIRGMNVAVEASDPGAQRVLRAIAQDAGFTPHVLPLQIRRAISVWDAFWGERHINWKQLPYEFRGPVPGVGAVAGAR